MKRAKVCTGDGDIVVQETSPGIVEIIVSELHLNQGRLSIKGGRDGGVRDFGREHAFILDDPELVSAKSIIKSWDDYIPGDETVASFVQKLKDEGWQYHG